MPLESINHSFSVIPKAEELSTRFSKSVKRFLTSEKEAFLQWAKFNDDSTPRSLHVWQRYLPAKFIEISVNHNNSQLFEESQCLWQSTEMSWQENRNFSAD